MRLFGTDGVRGVAGEFLTADLALRLGRAAALTSPVDHPQVLIVRDTRESGEMLEAALAAGIAAGGGHALLGGVLPTPGASVLVRRYGFEMAAVVSASHNPYQDNGIKFFGPEGMKIGDDQEAEIERRLDEPSTRIGRLRELHGAGGTTCASSSCASRASTSAACGCCSTARTARPTASRPRSSGASAPRWTRSPWSPTAATSTTAWARPTSRRSASAWTATTWRSRSTATATACSPSTATAPSSTATS